MQDASSDGSAGGGTDGDYGGGSPVNRAVTSEGNQRRSSRSNDGRHGCARGTVLVETEPEHQPRHDDDSTADPKQAADESGDESERNRTWGGDGHRGSVPTGSQRPACIAGSPFGYPDTVRFLMLGLVVLLAACNDAAPPETLPLELPDPVEVVEQWLQAVDEVDTPRLETLVEPIGLAVLAGVENRVRSAEMAGLLDSGVTGQLAQGYWQSFRDDFEAFRGIDIGSILVGEERPVASNPDHVAVEISAGEQTAPVVLRISNPVGWQVDMVATIGPSLVSQLRTYLESALEGEYAEPIVAAYRSAVVPGLDAATVLDPDDALLIFETEFIRQLVGT